MTKYREILRFHCQGISQRKIAVSCACSRNTVAKTLARTAELGISKPLPEGTTDGEFDKRFTQRRTPATRPMPDFLYK